MRLKKLVVLGTLTAALLTACQSNNTETQEQTTAGGQEQAAENTENASDDTSWPERTIEMVVPLKAGGDTDFYARTYAKYLEKELGQTITIINMEGAGGTVGAQSVIDADNDGYRILFYHTGNLYTNKMLGTTDIDQNSFDVSCVGVIDDTNVLVARKNLGVTDGKDFLEKAKAEPGKYSCATTISGFSYFTLCKLEEAGGFEVNPVDSGGASAMIPALLGDQVDLAVNSYGVFKQYVDNGDLVPLVLMDDERNPQFPDVPTATELGIEGAASERAYFFAFPKGTDPAIVKKLSDAVGKVQENPEYVKDIADAYCVEPSYIPYESVGEYMDEMWNEMEPFTEALTQ